MSILTDLFDFERKIISIFSKQTEVSAECEDSIQFEDKYGNFIINDSTVNIYQY